MDNLMTDFLGQTEEDQNVMEPQVEMPAASVVSEPTPSIMTEFLGESNPAPTPAPQGGNLMEMYLEDRLPKGEYTFDTMVGDPYAMGKVNDFLIGRFGTASVEGLDDRDKVDMFYNELRGRDTGNSVRVAKSLSHTLGATDEQKAAMAEGQRFYEKEVAGLFSGEQSTLEILEGVGDYTRSAILDPANVIGMGVGGAVGKSVFRVGAGVAKQQTMNQIKGQALKAALKVSGTEAKKATIAKGVKLGIQANNGVVTKTTAAFAKEVAESTVMQKVLSKHAIAEIGTATVVDAVVQSGAELLDQMNEKEIGFRDSIDRYAVGLTAIGGLVLGGIVGAGTAMRGVSKTGVISTLEPTSKKAIMPTINESIQKFLKEGADRKIPRGYDWAAGTARGGSLGEVPAEAFMDVLVGVTDNEGDVVFKGIAQALEEGGHFFQRQGEEDTISKWMIDFVRSGSTDDAKTLAKHLGVTKLDDVTPDSLADQMAYKIKTSGQLQNRLSQIAKSRGLTDAQVEEYLDSVLGLTTQTGNKASKHTAWEAAGEVQSLFIRGLVSHPSTSWLNAKGAVLHTMLDVTKDLIKGTGAAVFKGKEGRRAAGQIFKNVGYRAKLALDPDMSHAGFEALMALDFPEIRKLQQVQSGGIDAVTSRMNNADLGAFGRGMNKAGNLMDKVQAATFVQMQDRATKSQIFMGSLDKNLRIAFDKSLYEILQQDDAWKIINSKEFRNAMSSATEDTLAGTFNKEYADTSFLGKAAGLLEHARREPVIGALIPFGRFFNNTVDFGMQYSGLGLAAKMSGKYTNKSYTDLLVTGAIGAGLVASLAHVGYEDRKKGLGFGQKFGSDGSVTDVAFDYPESFFRAAGQILSYPMYEDTLPPLELMNRFGQEHLGGSLFRSTTNLWAEGQGMVEGVLEGDADMGMVKDAFFMTFGQLMGGGLRAFEPIDTAIGLATGAEMRPTLPSDKYSYNSYRYFDNTLEAMFGEKPEVAAGALTGDRDPNLGKLLGSREVDLTYSQMIANTLGHNDWTENAKRKEREANPVLMNDYHKVLFEGLELEAQNLWENTNFRDLPREQQELLWKEKLAYYKDTAKQYVINSSDNPYLTTLQMDLAGKYTERDIHAAVRELDLGSDTIADLSPAEIETLNQYLSLQESIKKTEATSALKEK